MINPGTLEAMRQMDIEHAWAKVNVPPFLRDRYAHFGLITNENGIVLASSPQGRYIYLRACTPHVERRALAFFWTASSDRQAVDLLQHAVDVFSEKAVPFDEGGVLPAPQLLTVASIPAPSRPAVQPFYRRKDQGTVEGCKEAGEDEAKTGREEVE